MDARLLRYYNQELRYLRELGGDFAREFPKIASRLGMEGLEVTDPYVERLLEGCAFLAARVQLKQDAEFPRLSHRLLELIYPNFLAPVPSMLVAQITPVPDANLLKGPVLAARHASAGPRSRAHDTRCEFRTAQPVQLTPLNTTGSGVLPQRRRSRRVASSGCPQRPRCGVRITLAFARPACRSRKLEIDSLRFFLGGQTDDRDAAARADPVHHGRRAGRSARHGRRGSSAAVAGVVGHAGRLRRRRGDAAGQLRGLSGMRLLQEYFAFPGALPLPRHRRAAPAFWRHRRATSVEIVLLFSRLGQGLDGAVDAGQLLRCTACRRSTCFRSAPTASRSTKATHEFHVVARPHARRSTTRSTTWSACTATTTRATSATSCRCTRRTTARRRARAAYYTIWREPRLMSEQRAARRTALGLHRLRGLRLAGRSGRCAVPRVAAPARAADALHQPRPADCSCRAAARGPTFTLDAGMP